MDGCFLLMVGPLKPLPVLREKERRVVVNATDFVIRSTANRANDAAYATEAKRPVMVIMMLAACSSLLLLRFSRARDARNLKLATKGTVIAK